MHACSIRLLFSGAVTLIAVIRHCFVVYRLAWWRSRSPTMYYHSRLCIALVSPEYSRFDTFMMIGHRCGSYARAQASLVISRFPFMFWWCGQFSSYFISGLCPSASVPLVLGIVCGRAAIGPGAVIINVMDQIMTSIGHESRAPFLKELTAVQPCKEGR